MTFLNAYITAALALSTDDDGVPLDETPHELHPDKGGDSDRFVRLTAAYEELLSSLP